MEQVLTHLQHLEERDEAIERLIDWIERDRRGMALNARGRLRVVFERVVKRRLARIGVAGWLWIAAGALAACVLALNLS